MKVLLAEDDRATLLRLKSFVSRWGYEVVTATNGDEAWAILEQASDIDMVIADWQMPGLDGPDVIRNLRALSGRRYVFAILLTARSEREDIIIGMDSGADDFICKPFDQGELRVRLQAGERILALEHGLARRNRELEAAYDEISCAHESIKRDLQAAAEVQKAFFTEGDAFGTEFAIFLAVRAV